MAPVKHFLAQIEQPMQRAGSVRGKPFSSKVIARYGQRAQLPQETHRSGLASEIFLTGVSAMKSVMGCGWAMPINSFIETDAAFLHQEGGARFQGRG